jgi:hypothetical protein
MGFYIDPENESKEEWLQKNAKTCSQSHAETADYIELFPVVLIDNGIFTAAAIAYNKREFEALTLPEDFRPRKFFIAEREKLTPFCPVFDAHIAW